MLNGLRACSVYPSVLFKRVAMALKDGSSGISRDELFDLAMPALTMSFLLSAMT